MYQQTRLSDISAIGAPASLPYAVANWHDAELANLDAMGLDPSFGLTGMGFWPVDVTVPAHDAARQVVVDPTACDKADPVARRWSAMATLREMTAAEFTSANPPIFVTGNQWAFALSDLGLASAWLGGLAKSKASDQVRHNLIARDTPLLAADPLLARIAANAGYQTATDGKPNTTPLIDVPTVHAHAQGMPL